MDALAERILSDIIAVFKRDPNIVEFSVIPADEAQNKSPVIHVGHSVGLQSWCVQHVYRYCYEKLFDWRVKRRKTEFLSVIRWSIAVLLLNPDVHTVWNVRKEIVEAGVLTAEQDLHFSSIVITRKPKSSDIFSHRKWLMKHIIKNQQLPIFTDELVDRELAVCLLAASKYSNNYYAWSHRTWVLQHVATPSIELLLKELKTNENWMSTHVSDYSGMQFRQFLLDNIILIHETVDEPNGKDSVDKSPVHSSDQNVSCKNGDSESDNNSHGAAEKLCKISDLLTNEMLLSNELILLYPGHEALWYHRRYLLHAFKKFKLLYGSAEAAKIFTDQLKNTLIIGPSRKKTKLESDSVPKSKFLNIEKELAFVESCCKSTACDPIQIRSASRHKKWIESCLPMEGFDMNFPDAVLMDG